MAATATNFILRPAICESVVSRVFIGPRRISLRGYEALERWLAGSSGEVGKDGAQGRGFYRAGRGGGWRAPRAARPGRLREAVGLGRPGKGRTTRTAGWPFVGFRRVWWRAGQAAWSCRWDRFCSADPRARLSASPAASPARPGC
jgi:hypothetical protein